MTKKNQPGTDQSPAPRKYKDPLHFSHEDLTVRYGDRAIMLNKALLDQQNAWSNLKTLKSLHLKKLKTYEKMENTDCPAALRAYDELLNRIEYKLQDAWGFPRDPMFFRFWERPKCTCPKLDNMDAYPYRRVYVGNCPLHSGALK